eukprot:gnl/MRDRNA2_/MRDRNA2_95419_c0_seq1.p1 gnl/MRDRNA2_/MRDRNA2_95419_c0~~gnl/MRDRNA2_/MRDRNA2_95419_c0_seq1.p1  ORF type:complete len:851 (+),score=179.76 gnl/MRDRNA2_/MRDRNA2_95419_c0_seq1:135-2687(+)
MSRSWLSSLVKPGPIHAFDDINVSKGFPNPVKDQGGNIQRAPFLVFSQKRIAVNYQEMLQSAWEDKQTKTLHAKLASTQSRWAQPRAPVAKRHSKGLMFSRKRASRQHSPVIDGNRAALISRMQMSGRGPRRRSFQGEKVDETETKMSGQNRGKLKRTTTQIMGASKILLRLINPRSKVLEEDENDKSPQSRFNPELEPPAVEIESEAGLTFSPLEVNVLNRYFTLRDMDDSCSLSFDELMLVIDDLGRMPSKNSEYWPLLMKLRHEYDNDGNGELDFQEFVTFVAAYYKSVYYYIFKKHDTEGDEVVNLQELGAMLNDLNNAGFVAHGENLGKLLRLVDSDCNDLLDFNEFCELMKHYRILEFGQLQKNAGFSAEELAMYTSAFNSSDKDMSGTIDIKEVTALFQDMGKPIHDIDRFVALFSRLDVDRSACLDFEEFVRLLKVWDKERMRSVTMDSCGGGITKGSSHKKRTLRISEVVQRDTDASEDKYEQIILTSFLEREAVGTDVEDGVMAAQWDVPLWEVRALRESFEYSDADGSGEIDAHDELAKILECAGIDITTGMQQKILEQWKSSVAARGDKLDFYGVIKFYSQYASLLTRGIFDSMGCAGGTMTLVQIITALYQVGKYLTKQQVLDILQEVGTSSTEHLDEATFQKLLKNHQKMTLQAWISRCGFSEAEIENFNKVFMEQTAWKGHLPLDRATEVLKILEYRLSSDAERNSVMSALTRVDRAGTGFLELRDVMLLIRHLENHRLGERRLEEAKASEAIGLDPESTCAFRRMFRRYSEDHMSQNPEVPKKMIKHLLINDMDVAATHEQRDELDRLLQKYSASFTFLQFLRFMLELDETGAF